MTTIAQPNGAGRRERRRFTPEQIARHLEAQAQSGLSVAQYCGQHQFHPSLLYAWKRKGRLRPAATPHAGPPRFQELSLAPLLGPSWGAEVSWPSGVTLRLGTQASARWVGQLVRHLGRVC